MLLTFASQGPPCEVLDRVEVDETDTRLTITLYHGRDPDAVPDESVPDPYRLDVEHPRSWCDQGLTFVRLVVIGHLLGPRGRAPGTSGAGRAGEGEGGRAGGVAPAAAAVTTAGGRG
jgi:hypothetical protein